jgi:hypothetical protein
MMYPQIVVLRSQVPEAEALSLGFSQAGTVMNTCATFCPLELNHSVLSIYVKGCVQCIQSLSIHKHKLTVIVAAITGLLLIPSKHDDGIDFSDVEEK